VGRAKKTHLGYRQPKDGARVQGELGERLASNRNQSCFVWEWAYFAENHLNKFVAAGKAMKFDKNTPVSQLGEFIKLNIV
jgi:hypothetical protein